jgi:hypothetical protein
MLIGTYIDADDGQWAVVGGSGEFLYAQGAINYKVLEHGKGLILRELDIRVLCPNTTIIPIPPVSRKAGFFVFQSLTYMDACRLLN